jgi:hypothetical protein
MALCLLAVFVSGCKTRGFGGKLSSSLNDAPVVLVHCMSPQGNGGNWAATLGWIASDYEVLAERASLMAARGTRPVYIYPRCFSGGSSGSGAANVVMGLLANDKVLSNQGSASKALRAAGFFSAEEMRAYGRAMRFLAMSVDLTIQESLLFFGTVFKEQVKAAASNVLPGAQAHWWATSLATAEGAVVDFGKLVHAASLLDASDVNAPIESIFGSTLTGRPPLQVNGVNEQILKLHDSLQRAQRKGSTIFARLLDFAKSNGLNRVSDQSRYRTLGGLNCSLDSSQCIRGRLGAARWISNMMDLPATDSNNVESAAQASADEGAAGRYAMFYLIEALQAYHAGVRVDELAARDLAGEQKRISPSSTALGTLLRGKQVFNDEMRNPSAARSSLTGSLIMPMQTGFVTTTSALISRNEDPQAKQSTRPYFRRVPDFKDLSFVGFMDRTTAEAIKRSQLFRDDVSGCTTAGATSSEVPCRFVLAEVGSRVYSMLPSVREPGLMEELYAPAFVKGRAGSEHLGILRLFDPRHNPGAEAPGGAVDLEMRTVDMAADSAAGPSTYFAVTGGWLDRRLSSWLLLYYMDTLLGRDADYGVAAQFQRATGSLVRPVVVGSVSLFGKPDSVSAPQLFPDSADDGAYAGRFDMRAVSTVFVDNSNNSGGDSGVSTEFGAPRATANRVMYLEMFRRYYNFFTASQNTLDRNGVPVSLTETVSNWDLSTVRLPAFIPAGFDGGATRFLVSLSHNTVNEGLLALDEVLPADGTGSDERQICSLSRYQRDFEREFKWGPIKFGRLTPAGKVYLDRISCMRRLAGINSLRRFSELGLPEFRQELRHLATTATVTFNAMDPRINKRRADAVLVVEDQEGHPAIIKSEEVPPLTPNQEALLKATGSDR